MSVNAEAGRQRVVPGLRYAAGLSLAPTLQAGTVAQREVAEGVRRILRRLHTLSPQVEPCPEPGLFWLDATGLVPLYDSLERWVERVLAELEAEGFSAAVAVGFSRFGCYAGARTMAGVAAASAAGPRTKMFVSREQERAAALGAPLTVLTLEPPILERLEMLGVRSVGEFLKLPAGGVRRRFGPGAESLYRFAAGVLAGGVPELPLQPRDPELQASYTALLPLPSSETLRLLNAAAECLDSLLQATEARQDMVQELHLLLKIEEGEPTGETITPAVPTRDRRLLLELVALRLESLRLPGPAVAVTLGGAYTRETIAQRELFVQRSAQARAAAAQTFARLRAVFGNQAVQWACLEDEHLPERSYRWENLERLPDPAAAAAPPGRLASRMPPAPRAAHLVRRVYRRPQPLSGLPAAKRPPSDRRLWGPYLLSGHWWEWEVSREYYYVEDAAGALLWLYRDLHSRRWWIAGRVE